MEERISALETRVAELEDALRASEELVLSHFRAFSHVVKTRIAAVEAKIMSAPQDVPLPEDDDDNDK